MTILAFPQSPQKRFFLFFSLQWPLFPGLNALFIFIYFYLFLFIFLYFSLISLFLFILFYFVLFIRLFVYLFYFTGVQ